MTFDSKNFLVSPFLFALLSWKLEVEIKLDWFECLIFRKFFWRFVLIFISFEVGLISKKQGLSLVQFLATFLRFRRFAERKVLARSPRTFAACFLSAMS